MTFSTVPRSLLTVVVLFGAGFAGAEEQPIQAGAEEQPIRKEKSPTTDEALLRKLLGDEPMEPATPPSGEAADEAAPSTTTEPEVRADEAGSPLDSTAIARLMERLKHAETRLAAGETGKTTQTAQSDVVTELSHLIDEAEKQSNSASSAGSPSGDGGEAGGASSGTPMPRSGSKPEPSGTGTPQSASGVGEVPAGAPARNREGPADESSERVREESVPSDPLRGFRADLVEDVWGHLPQRLRDQMINTGSDRYLPQYDSLVRDYFESLARPESKSGTSRP